MVYCRLLLILPAKISGMAQKRFFPNLNGIRFIAAFMVLFHHVEQAKHAMGIGNVYDRVIVQHMGRLGVGLFFVLSGFLITYLLLQERQNHGDISAKRFYLRRAFRIWPVYFVVVLSSYFLFPHIPLLEFPGAGEKVTNYFWERLSFLVLILPNFAFILYDLPYWCAQAWSIGVEEQFYYLWPWMIKYPRRRWGILLLFIAITALVLGVGLWLLDDPEQVKIEKALAFAGQFRLQVMAFGGMLAWLAFREKHKILRILFRKDVQYAVYALTLVFFISGVHFTGFMEFYGVLFGFFVVNLACNPNSVIHLEHKWIDYLGKISYGIYLYHVVAIVLTINILKHVMDESGSAYHFVLYTITILLTILICVVSYEWMEKPLLRFKDKRYGR